MMQISELEKMTLDQKFEVIAHRLLQQPRQATGILLKFKMWETYDPYLFLEHPRV